MTAKIAVLGAAVQHINQQIRLGVLKPDRSNPALIRQMLDVR